MSDLDHSSGKVVDVRGGGDVALSAADYDRVFAILDYCSAARTLDQLKNLLMVALHDHYGCPNTTFLSGPTFTTAFADPNPVTTGRITPILDEYQAHWYLDGSSKATPTCPDGPTGSGLQPWLDEYYD